MRIISLLFISIISVTLGLQQIPAADNTNLLRRVMHAVPTILDPQRYSNRPQLLVLTDMFIGLTALDPDGNIIAGIARNWQVSEDGKTYTFHLREDAIWQDGTQVMAQDFVLAFRRLFTLADEAALSNLYSNIKGSSLLRDNTLPVDPNSASPLGVTAPNKLTLLITLHRPFPSLLFLLTRPAAFPVPSHIYAKAGEDWSLTENIIGNGPYLLGVNNENQDITLHKSASFFDSETVKIETVRYFSIPKGETLTRFLITHRGDVSRNIPYYQVTAAKRLQGFRLHSKKTINLSTIFFNKDMPALQDINIRKALYLSTGRANIARALNADFKPVYGLVPPIDGFESAVATIKDKASAIQTAQYIMLAAGYSANNPLRLSITIQDIKSIKSQAVILQRHWRNIYVDLTIVPVAFNQWMTDFTNVNFNLLWMQWAADYPDPYNFLELHTKNFNSKLNPADDPILQNLIEKADTDLINRYTHLQQAEVHLMQNYPAIPLYQIPMNFLVANHVKGWSSGQESLNSTRWLSLDEKQQN